MNDAETTAQVLHGSLDEFHLLDSRTSALVRIAGLISMAPNSSSCRWAMDQALAAGVDDEQVFSAIIAIAPIVGLARLTEGLSRLLEALELEVVEG